MSEDPTVLVVDDLPQNARLLDAVLAKAAGYLKEYRERLTYVMATERSKQTLVGPYAAGGKGTAEEKLASDV